MRTVVVIIANALLWGYFADSVVTIIDLLWGGDRKSVIFSLRQYLANAVLVQAALWLALLAALGHWLKRWHLFWLAISACWLNMGGQPIGFFFDGPTDSHYSVTLGSAQFLIACMTIARVRALSGNWMLNSGFVVSPQDGVVRWGRRLLGRSLAVCGLYLLYLPLHVLTISVQDSAGFLGANWKGIYVRDFEFADPQGGLLRLVGTVHVGEPAFYESMLESFEGPNTVILEEGVRDESNVMVVQARRRRTMDRYAVLSMQPAMTEVRGARPISQVDHRTGWVNVLNADVALSALSEQTRQWAEESSVFVSKVRRGNANYFELLFDDVTLSLSKDVFAELIFERNEHLIGKLTAVQGAFDQIIVPWGAMHMPDLVRRVGALGYAPTGVQRSHEIIRWSTLWQMVRSRSERRTRRLGVEELERIALRGTMAMQESRLPTLQLFPAEQTSDNRSLVGHFGGLPSRYADEVWPRNPLTNRPMSFVLELFRTESSAGFLGDISRLRLFVDYEAFAEGEDSASYTLWLTRVGDETRAQHNWSDADLEALEQAFNAEPDKAWMGSSLSWPETPLHAEPLLMADSELISSRIVLLDRESLSNWYSISESALEEFSKQFPDTLYDAEGSHLGGYPNWIQGPDYQRLPFFLQLHPKGDMMWGDSGMFYLFLDPSNPQDSRLLGQMH
ncbi:MAG: DUF1963 domain-containing protein [Pseudomonadota bacterium]